MSSMDGDMKKDILDVRKVIERSTSKVSLRDLEKKGFRKVKVLRAGDINQLIYKAVQTVLAKQPAVGMDEGERERVLAEARAEYERQTKQFSELQEASERVEAEKQQIQEAHQNLKAKLDAANGQLISERNKILEARKVFEEEKRQLEREKSMISEKGMDAVQAAQRQMQDLQDRLAQAESRAGGVSQEQYNQLHSEARERVSALNTKIEELERALRKAQNDNQMVEETAAGKTRSLSAQLDDSEQRARKLAARVGELEADVAHVRAELEQERSNPKVASGMGSISDGDVDKLREEMQAQMQAQQAQQAQMLATILGAVNQAPAPVAAAAGNNDAVEKSLKAFQMNVMDTIRKLGSGMKGFEENSTMDIGALLAQGADVKVETNIKDVGVQTQSAKSVKDKLSKLRSMKGGGPPK
jgi:DNA repair exonuclease SbcCD ATPase subunit